MISTKKDAATIRAVIQKLRNAPVPNLLHTRAPDGDPLERKAQRHYVDWATHYLVGDLLAMLPDDEKPARPFVRPADEPL